MDGETGRSSQQRDVAALLMPRLGEVCATSNAALPWIVTDGAGQPVGPASDFLRHLLASGNSASSCRSYAFDLLRWLRFLAAVDVWWDRAQRSEVRDFVLWLRVARNPARDRRRAGAPAAEGKPQVEQYGLDELVASAELVVPGLGPLAAGLARLAGEACGAVMLDAMELLVIERGRELLRGLVQLGLDSQAAAEVPLAEVTGTDGVRRTRAGRGHARTVVTGLGAVRVRRIGYRSGVTGAGSLFPRDAVLNLPPLGYSWALQRLAEMFCRSGSYAQAHEFVLAVTGVSIGKRQLEQITAAAAADAERFCQDPGARPGELAVPDGGGDGQELAPLVVLSADGKGVAMRPEARRRRAKAPDQRMQTFEHRGERP